MENPQKTKHGPHRKSGVNQCAREG